MMLNFSLSVSWAYKFTCMRSHSVLIFQRVKSNQKICCNILQYHKKMKCNKIIKALLIVLIASESAESINLNCESIVIKWNYVGEVETCSARNVNITTSDEVITTVNGQFASQFRSRNLKVLFIYRETLHYIPKEIDAFFPHLEVLAIHLSGLKTLEQSDLRPFTELKFLDLYINQIASISNDLFDSNPELRSVRFYSNKLKLVGPNILNKLRKLTEADFENNICINKYANNPERIQELKILLAAQCQGTTTTERPSTLPTERSQTKTDPSKTTQEDKAPVNASSFADGSLIYINKFGTTRNQIVWVIV